MLAAVLKWCCCACWPSLCQDGEFAYAARPRVTGAAAPRAVSQRGCSAAHDCDDVRAIRLLRRRHAVIERLAAIVAAAQFAGTVESARGALRAAGKQGNNSSSRSMPKAKRSGGRRSRSVCASAVHVFRRADQARNHVSCRRRDTPARQQKAWRRTIVCKRRERSIETDPNIRAMRDIFGATVQPDSDSADGFVDE